MQFDPYQRTPEEAKQENKSTYVADGDRPERTNYQALIREVPRYGVRST